MLSNKHLTHPVSDSTKLRAENEIEDWWNGLRDFVKVEWLNRLQMATCFAHWKWCELPNLVQRTIIEDWAKCIEFYGH
jgi:hypothetical protein